MKIWQTLLVKGVTLKFLSDIAELLQQVTSKEKSQLEFKKDSWGRKNNSSKNATVPMPQFPSQGPRPSHMVVQV